MLCSLKQTKLIQAAPLREFRPAPIHEIFTPFTFLAPVHSISSYPKREQIVTEIFPSALKADFAIHLTVELAFPPTNADNIIYASVLRYQTYMEGVVDGIKNVCGCFGLFILLNTSTVYNMSQILIQNSLASNLVMLLEVDCCAILEGALRLYKKCIQLLSHTKRPKFGFGNSLPKLWCQSYPTALKGLFVANEAAIAYAYPVVSIFKLRPNWVFNLAVYNCIKGHAFLLAQNPTPLLNLFPSSSMELHDVIHIVWARNGQPSDYNRRHFI